MSRALQRMAVWVVAGCTFGCTGARRPGHVGPPGTTCGRARLAAGSAQLGGNAVGPGGRQQRFSR